MFIKHHSMFGFLWGPTQILVSFLLDVYKCIPLTDRGVLFLTDPWREADDLKHKEERCRNVCVCRH